MNFFHENININYLKQIIMVMVQVVTEWSKKWYNLNSKKWSVNPVTPCFDFKIILLVIGCNLLSNSL